MSIWIMVPPLAGSRREEVVLHASVGCGNEAVYELVRSRALRTNLAE